MWVLHECSGSSVHHASLERYVEHLGSTILKTCSLIFCHLKITAIIPHIAALYKRERGTYILVCVSMCVCMQSHTHTHTNVSSKPFPRSPQEDFPLAKYKLYAPSYTSYSQRRIESLWLSTTQNSSFVLWPSSYDALFHNTWKK